MKSSRSDTILMACIGIGLLVLVLYYANSIYYVVTHENAYFDFVSIVYMALPVAIVLIDFFALRERKWRNWSIASLCIKSYYVVRILIPQIIYEFSRLLNYGWYSNLLLYLGVLLFIIIIAYPSVYNIKNATQKDTIDSSGNKKSISRLTPLSIAAITIGLAIAVQFLIGGIASIGADGYASLGVIFILPAILAIGIILADFFALRECKWRTWSIVSICLKVLFVLPIIQSSFYAVSQMLKGNTSNALFFMGIIIFVAITIIPSVCNIKNIAARQL